MKTRVRLDFEKWYIATKCGTTWEAWQHQAARIAELEAQVKQLQLESDALHMSIMNIPVECDSLCLHELAYKEGHRDARHAAAELVLQAAHNIK